MIAGGVSASRSIPARVLGVIADIGLAAGVVAAIPVGILIIGAPLALAGKALLSAAGWLFGG